jgi:hypothetical protein
MSLMELGLAGGYLVCFARFCTTFCDVLARGGGLSAMEQAGAHAIRSLQRLFGGLDDFSDIFLHGLRSPDDCFYCALLGVNCPQNWRGFLALLVVCFVWFSDGAEIVGG